ncbi:TetR/AcrR family transcriptional regulator [Sphingobium sp.]|uniref:TetR/AcrR family transcriptional regulator n=1 Tax=Sphingobium sp. TaxID=1912891 RepID=UPI0028BE505F|nr:hypothetical protein [Sphingobium sp.]
MNDRGTAGSDKSATRSKLVAPTRRPGRPPASEKGEISRQSIIEAALKLSKTISLQDLSIVVVARSMNVTPALIHYYIGGRDWLTSGVMNLFYKSLLRKWPQPTGDWEEDLVAAGRRLFTHLSAYPGIAAYLVSHNRFRIFQMVGLGDRDYGVEMLERFAGIVRQAGLSPERTGIYTHLIMDFLISTAHGTSQKLFPSEHRQFLEEKVAKLDQEKSANILFARVSPLHLDGALAFEEGISLFKLGLQRDREVEGVVKGKTARKPRKTAKVGA